jgi:hypothetical protein
MKQYIITLMLSSFLISSYSSCSEEELELSRSSSINICTQSLGNFNVSVYSHPPTKYFYISETDLKGQITDIYNSRRQRHTKHELSEEAWAEIDEAYRTFIMNPTMRIIAGGREIKPKTFGNNNYFPVTAHDISSLTCLHLVY